MSELTIQAAGFTLQPLIDLRDGPAEIRWYYNRSFLTNDNIQVQWGTGTTGFWITTPCSIANGLITVDLDTLLWTTDDAQDPSPASILLSAGLYSSRGKLIQQLLIAGKPQWVVPSSQVPTTTWSDFSAYNQAVFLANPPVVFYTAAQVDALVDRAFDEHPASDTELGTVLLTIPADIPATPVVWGANDPLVRDAVSLEGVAISDVAPLDGQVLTYNQANNEAEWANSAAGTGNVISNEVASVDGEMVEFAGTGGKTIKRSTLTGGLLRATDGIAAISTVATADIDDDAVTYAKQQNVSAASRVLGRGSAAGAGSPEELTLGSGLSLTGTVLSATGTGGDVTAASNLTDEAVVVGDGGAKGVQTTPVTINPGTGLVDGATVDDPTASQEIASKNYVDSAVAVVASSIPLISGLASGGIVFWESAYTFRVSAATYFIQGIFFSSIEQTVTLDAADPTLDRIDVLVLDNTGTLAKITGVAAAQPSEPDYDPTTQLKLTFVFVGASTTQPAGVANEDIYLENTEWTSSTSGSGWNPASTSNPYSGTTDIEGTNVANNAYVQLERASPTALDSFAVLTMFIRSKATWGNNRVLRVQFFSNGVAIGTAITIATGFWGFNSSTTGVYQFIGIPMQQFVIAAGTQVNQLRITDVGGAIGMFIDNIVLQAVGTSIGPPAPSTGITQDQADARYLQIANNLSDVLVDATARGNIGAAPAAATYLVQTANGELGAEQAMGALATGLVKNTTTTGVQSIAAAGSDYVAPGDVTSSGLTMATNRLLGRSTGGTGAIEEIALGTNLSYTGTTLNAAGSTPTDSIGIIQMLRTANYMM